MRMAASAAHRGSSWAARQSIWSSSAYSPNKKGEASPVSEWRPEHGHPETETETETGWGRLTDTARRLAGPVGRLCWIRSYLFQGTVANVLEQREV